MMYILRMPKPTQLHRALRAAVAHFALIGFSDHFDFRNSPSTSSSCACDKTTLFQQLISIITPQYY